MPASRATAPVWSASTAFWRDFGFVMGALIAGFGADATSASTAILIVATLTAASGLLVAATSWQQRATLRPVSSASASKGVA